MKYLSKKTDIMGDLIYTLDNGYVICREKQDGAYYYHVYRPLDKWVRSGGHKNLTSAKKWIKGDIAWLDEEQKRADKEGVKS